MKMKHLKVAAILLSGALLTSSCVGSFGLFNKLASWNKGATNEKFLNELIFLIISPAYAVCGVVDVLVLNTIEFWSGHNPVAQRIGTTQEVMGQDGRYYAVTTLKDGYKIKKPTGEEITFKYNKKTRTWSEQSDGKSVDLFRFNSDGTIQAYLPGGGDIKVSQDEAGLFQVRMATSGATFYAAR